MTHSEILRRLDHTLLSQTATISEITRLCEEAMRFGTASVCVPPCYVSQAKELVCGKTAVCTVIGFPNGYSETEVKIFEAVSAIKSGADEIDMVINLAMLKSGRVSDVTEEIQRVKDAAGDKILKVIIECGLLNDGEKITMCGVVEKAGADYIKTSTGFADGAATFDDVALIRRNLSPKVKIKASGGIASLSDAERFLKLGADRLGSSKIVRLISQPSCRDKGLDKNKLAGLAIEARNRSYSPYSNFKVGAALMTKSGLIYSGANIENSAYGPSNCAERTAVFKAISDGERDFAAIAVAGGPDGEQMEYCYPCGVCRQVLNEFVDPDEFVVIIAKGENDFKEHRLSELLPFAFRIGKTL